MMNNALCFCMSLCDKPTMISGRSRHAVSIDLMKGIGIVASRLLPGVFMAQGIAVPISKGTRTLGYRNAFMAHGAAMPIWRGSPPPDLIR